MRAKIKPNTKFIRLGSKGRLRRVGRAYGFPISLGLMRPTFRSCHVYPKIRFGFDKPQMLKSHIDMIQRAIWPKSFRMKL